MASCGRNTFHITAPVCGNPPVISGLPTQQASNTSIDDVFDISLIKPLNKQCDGQCYEISKHSCDATNGLLPESTKLLPEPMLTKFYEGIWHHQSYLRDNPKPWKFLTHCGLMTPYGDTDLDQD